MQHVDGELAAGEAADVEAAIARDPALRGKAEGVRELTELVRGHLELAADAAEPRFANLWSQIEKRIEHDRAPATPKRESSAMDAAPAGLWGRFARWLDRRRGHILTGVASAGAVAAIALLIRGTADQVTEPGDGAIPVVPVVDHRPPEVESLDVPEGSGTVFTIEDDDGDGDATVIWVTPADTVEGL